MKENIEIRRANLADATSIALLGRVTYTQSHGRYIENKKSYLNFIMMLIQFLKLGMN